MNKNFNDEKIQKLSDKIFHFQNLDLIQQSNKFSLIEDKIEVLESNFMKSIKDFEYKKKYMNEDFDYISKLLEDNKEHKKSVKNKIDLELTSIEANIKNSLIKERQSLNLFTSNLFNSLENEIVILDENMKKEKNNFSKKIQKIKDFIENDLSCLNKKIEENITNETKNVVQKLKKIIHEKYLYIISLV